LLLVQPASAWLFCIAMGVLHEFQMPANAPSGLGETVQLRPRLGWQGFQPLSILAQPSVLPGQLLRKALRAVCACRHTTPELPWED